MPSWWLRNYGIEYGEKMVFDPDYRVQAHQEMRRLLHSRYPEIPMGSANPEPMVIQPDFNNATIPAIAGCSVSYPADNYPCNDHLPLESILKLKIPSDLSQALPFREIDRQVHYLNRKLSQDTAPSWNVRGTLNDAVLIKGSDFFADLYSDPELASELLDYTSGILLAAIQRNHATGRQEMAMLCNCSVMMISPSLYRQRIFPYDRKAFESVRQLHQDFGIHHCGDFTLYSESYRSLPGVDFLEIGWNSNLADALRIFPETTIQFIFNASFLASASVQQVGEKMESILDASRGHWSRLRLSVPDIEFGTPEENLFEIYRRCRDAR